MRPVPPALPAARPSPEQIRQELHAAFSQIPEKPLILHTDLLRIGLVQRGMPLQEQLAGWLALLVEAAGDRALLFPTFNYDYPRTRVFDPWRDPSQVGTLNEYVRQRYPAHRTHTPIFNFAIGGFLGRQPAPFALAPADNPFSETSTFAELTREGGVVAFLGASFGANTFVHYVEEVMDVGYRYLKPFPGVIRQASGDVPFVLHYRVRPRVEGAVDYDWERLAQGLIASGLWHQVPLGRGQLLWFEAQPLLAEWRQRLLADELYLLTPTSQVKTKAIYARCGHPLRFETMEPHLP